MRMSGELKVNGKSRSFVGKIGFVGKQDDSFASGNDAQRFGEIGRSTKHIIHAGEPEAHTITFNRHRLIRQNKDALCLECARDVLRVGVEVVIAQYRPQAVRRGHLAKKASAWFHGGRTFDLVPNQGHRNKVSRENDQVRTKAIHQRNGGMQWVGGKIRVIMKIAEQGDGKAV